MASHPASGSPGHLPPSAISTFACPAACLPPNHPLPAAPSTAAPSPVVPPLLGVSPPDADPLLAGGGGGKKSESHRRNRSLGMLLLKPGWRRRTNTSGALCSDESGGQHGWLWLCSAWWESPVCL